MPAVTVSSSTSTEIVAADGNRTTLVITNSDSAINIHIAFGVTATTNDAYLAPGGNLTLAGDRLWKGAINGLAASGSPVAKYSKASPGA